MVICFLPLWIRYLCAVSAHVQKRSLPYTVEALANLSQILSFVSTNNITHINKMFPSFSKQLAYSYTKVSNSSQDDLELPNIHMRAQPRRPEPRLPQPVKMVACSLAFMLIGFFLGQGFAQRGLNFSSSLALAVKPHLFKMEAIYGAKPSNESDTAWSALMPKRGGFFNHPKIAPERSAYAVFHQLHCLVNFAFIL